ncbi:hypothetical protein VHEMI04326 [[Torrubiella] hemipterigena]|uniref:tripeptidyl-peptidase II n=1 Tax=[Torrubiella] hemipterigena TaxID=1531966 RepID=A0A0A1SUZ1_9HYPO|nr:hypothetical protein VHEMI04326 [[Torrubiella] hemipterigena]
MVAISKIVFVASAAVGAMAAPAQAQFGSLVQFEKLSAVPTAWASAGKADGATVVKAQIGIKQNNIKGLQEKLMDIANPESPNYGKWLSKEELAKFTAPAAADVDAVKAWLAANGITQVSMPTNDWIEFSAPIHQLESLLDAKYEMYTHSETGHKAPRTTAFSIPERLHSVIDVVTPTTTFYNSIRPYVHNSVAASSNTPAAIKSQYNVDYTPVGSSLVATTGFLDVGANHDDFNNFVASYSSGAPDFLDVGVNGGQNSGDGSQLEGNLDTQYMGGLANPLQSEYLAHAPTGADQTSFNDAMLALTNYLQTTDKAPTVVSTSYGGEEKYVSTNYLDRICNEFAKVGSLGISVFFSSGDYGVGGNGESSCRSGFFPTWPASCPYITSVGGTDFDASGNEVVADFSKYSRATSPGGGYSGHFPAPDYNKAVTSAYAKSLPASTQQKFKATGRGYPDISLVSVKYPVILGSSTKSVLGTSASSPATAALIGLINDYRQSQGQPNLGFLNPLLYSSKVSAAIRDVTSGSNKGCDSTGFPAKSGWDAASGLGSFDFAKLRQLA